MKIEEVRERMLSIVREHWSEIKPRRVFLCPLFFLVRVTEPKEVHDIVSAAAQVLGCSESFSGGFITGFDMRPPMWVSEDNRRGWALGRECRSLWNELNRRENTQNTLSFTDVLEFDR